MYFHFITPYMFHVLPLKRKHKSTTKDDSIWIYVLKWFKSSINLLDTRHLSAIPVDITFFHFTLLKYRVSLTVSIPFNSLVCSQSSPHPYLFLSSFLPVSFVHFRCDILKLLATIKFTHNSLGRAACRWLYDFDCYVDFDSILYWLS